MDPIARYFINGPLNGKVRDIHPKADSYKSYVGTATGEGLQYAVYHRHPYIIDGHLYLVFIYELPTIPMELVDDTYHEQMVKIIHPHRAAIVANTYPVNQGL